MSSAVSSRAPSPSPSLMSIIYPGIKPLSGRESLPATPLLGRTLHSSPSANTFQPIHSSNTNNSFGAPETSGVQQSHLVTVAVKKSPSRDVQQPDYNPSEKQAEEETSGITNPLSNNSSSPVHTMLPTVEGSSHQRSRSNEIDYVLSSRPLAISAFRTPSDSFRPLSAESTPLTLPTGPAMRTSSSEERIRPKSTACLKELEADSTIISEYFGTSEAIEQYLQSDKSLLKVADY